MGLVIDFGTKFPGFNGATSFQKWIGCEFVVYLLYRSRCFNGATSFQKWIDLATGDAGTGVERFNGATSFQKWIELPAMIIG